MDDELSARLDREANAREEYLDGLSLGDLAEEAKRQSLLAAASEGADVALWSGIADTRGWR